MKYRKILLCMTVLVSLAFLACAQSDPLGGSPSGTDQARNEMVGWLNQPIGESSSGYVRDRSMIDPGIAGMLHWLDTPVPNFPWYTTGGSFYSQPYSEVTFSPYTEYYTTTGTPVVGGIISNPTEFDITQKTPSTVYYGAGVGLPYTQYASTVPSKTNDLWIQGATNWTQYVVSPVGTWLQLIAYAPVEGPAGFYEMIQTDTTSSKYNTYQFNLGYNIMNFNADQVGRHMLYFVVNNQPSNVVVVDVFAQAPAGNGAISIYPAAIQTPVTVIGNSNGLTTATTSNGLTTTTSTGQTTITDTLIAKPGNAEGHTGAPGQN